MRGALATAAGLGVLVAVLVWTTLRGSEASCEVCMRVEGRQACMAVAAPTREEAVSQGRNNACGVLTEGMAAELACQRAVPASVTCTP